MILHRFPEPPAAVLRVLDQLAALRCGDADELATMGDLSNLPRPWDPSSCPPELRAVLWAWCDLVAAWVNREYTWRPTQMIPPCWPRHPHIARELPPLGFLRWAAETSTTPDALEEWHRYALPTFNDRLAQRLGEGTCRTGKHQDWPAEPRYLAYTEPDSAKARDDILYADTHPPALLRRHA